MDARSRWSQRVGRICRITAALHARAGSAVGLAVFGALTGVSALAALFLGVLLAG
jgi:hypothetical protein